MSYYQKNAEHLGPLKDMLDPLEPYPLKATPEGTYSVKIDNVYINSPSYPRVIARKWAEHTLKDDNKAWVYFVSGFGLGYHIIELLKKIQEQSTIIVAEPDYRLIKTALDIHDFTDIGRLNQIVLITEADRKHISEKLARVGDGLSRKVRVLESPCATPESHSFWHALVGQVVIGMADSQRVGILTQIKNSTITCRNLLNNAELYWDKQGVGPLAGIHKGKPAICISAGPSVDEALPLLTLTPENRSKYVLISVPTMLKSLLALDIEPDYVTTLDYHEVSGRFFEGVTVSDKCVLVAEPKVNGEVTKAWTGKLRLLANPWLDMIFKSFQLGFSPLQSGATVAHLSFGLAQHLGCDPIIMVGQDLAFPLGTDGVPQYYPKTVFEQHPWKCDGGTFDVTQLTAGQTRPLRMIKSYRDPPPRIPAADEAWEKVSQKFTDTAYAEYLTLKTTEPQADIFDIAAGEDDAGVLTDDQMLCYLLQFEQLWAASPARVIDCSKGAQKENAEHMDFADALEEIANAPPKLLATQPNIAIATGSTVFREKLGIRDSYEEIRLNALRLANTAQDAMDLIAEIVDALGDGIDDLKDLPQIEQDKVNSLNERLNELRGRAEINPALAIIEQFSGSAMLHRMRCDTQLVLDGTQGHARRLAQAERDKAYLTEIKRACEEFAAELDERITTINRKE